MFYGEKIFFIYTGKNINYRIKILTHSRKKSRKVYLTYMIQCVNNLNLHFKIDKCYNVLIIWDRVDTYYNEMFFFSWVLLVILFPIKYKKYSPRSFFKFFVIFYGL